MGRFLEGKLRCHRKLQHQACTQDGPPHQADDHKQAHSKGNSKNKIAIYESFFFTERSMKRACNHKQANILLASEIKFHAMQFTILSKRAHQVHTGNTAMMGAPSLDGNDSRFTTSAVSTSIKTAEFLGDT